MNLSKISILAWLIENNIKTEQGKLLDLRDHFYMVDIYNDFSPKQVWMKGAQVTASTCATLKAIWLAWAKKIDIVYLLPTEADRNIFVGGKVNRIIAQNPVLQGLIRDKDSIEQKQIAQQIIHFRGTFSKKSAIMVPSDLNIADEVDSSKQDVIELYASRLQHSSYRWQWFFSHPSASGYGVDKYWQISDQKHWFIKCPHCLEEHYLSWPESIDIEKEIYVCKLCGGELSDDIRRKGRWVKKFNNREYSGYWIPLLIVPKISAKQICAYYRDKPADYFYNMVLGLPYVGSGNKLTWELFAQNITGKSYTPTDKEQIVIGIDTGLKLDYVIGDANGLFYQSVTEDYEELDGLMRRWPRAVAVIDAGGDLIGSRKFYEKWTGRVFLCFLQGDRKTKEIADWKEGEEYGVVRVDRNRIIQMTVDEFSSRTIKVHGATDDWNSYWQDWNNLTRIKIYDPVTGEMKGYKWIRSGRDHLALATIFWRVGMDKYGWGGAEFIGDKRIIEAPYAPEIKPDNTIQPGLITGEDPITATIRQLSEDDDDWRTR